MFEDLEEYKQPEDTKEIKTAEQYTVYRALKLERENEMLEHRMRNTDYYAKRMDDVRQECQKEKDELKTQIAEKNNCINDLFDFKRGFVSLVRQFGWKAKRKTSKKGNKYYIVDKNKKQIEVEFEAFYAVDVINRKK